jgi:hypothetical protein
MNGWVRAMLMYDWSGTSHIMIGRVQAHNYCFGCVRAHDMDYVVG